MRRVDRRGKANQVMIAVVPPLIFIVGLMVYNAYKWIAPSAFTVAETKRVEALDVVGGISPNAKNGLILPQAESLHAGGSARLVISRPAEDGAFTLISGVISAGFLAEKNPLDSMLHLKFDKSNISVTSDGKPVDVVLLLRRTQTDPLVVDNPVTEIGVDVMDALYQDPKIQPAPAGTSGNGKFTGDNGMTVDCTMEAGRGGTLNMMDVVQLNFRLDDQSSAWVEIPRTVRVQHTAVGTEDLDIGLLVPRGEGRKRYVITMFGEEVAKVRQR